MFDNHFLWRRKKDIDYYDKTEESYLLVYSVNEAEGTVKQIKKISYGMVQDYIRSDL